MLRVHHFPVFYFCRVCILIFFGSCRGSNLFKKPVVINSTILLLIIIIYVLQATIIKVRLLRVVILNSKTLIIIYSIIPGFKFKVNIIYAQASFLVFFPTTIIVVYCRQEENDKMSTKEE